MENEEGLKMTKVIRPLLFLGQDVYLTTAKDKVRHLDCEGYSK